MPSVAGGKHGRVAAALIAGDNVTEAEWGRCLGSLVDHVDGAKISEGVKATGYRRSEHKSADELTEIVKKGWATRNAA